MRMTSVCKFFAASLLLVLTAIGAGCSDTPSANEAIHSARASLASDDFAGVRRALDPMLDNIDGSNLSVSQLCDMAIIYMKLSDLDDQTGHDAASALTCYRQAESISIDSIAEYFGSMNPDDAQYLFVLSSLSNGISSGSESLAEFDETDSNADTAPNDISYTETEATGTVSHQDAN